MARGFSHAAVTFEALNSKHAEEVLRIFNYYVEHSFAAYPERPLPAAFFTKIMEMTDGYPAFALKDPDGRVVGFCFLRAYNPMPAFRHTAEVSTFLDPEYVRIGLGTIMLRKLEQEAAKQGIMVLVAGISSKNPPSLHFYQKQGFVECGRFRGIGRKNGELFDVVWMQKTLC
jgi:L-amino acid N-acyltransferase YncA